MRPPSPICSSSNHTRYIIICQDFIGHAKISGIVKRCRLQQPFQLWCIALAASASWTSVDPRLRDLLANSFSGWVQSRINEKGNKILRDAATRDNASKVMGGGEEGMGFAASASWASCPSGWGVGAGRVGVVIHIRAIYGPSMAHVWTIYGPCMGSYMGPDMGHTWPIYWPLMGHICAMLGPSYGTCMGHI